MRVAVLLAGVFLGGFLLGVALARLDQFLREFRI